MTGPFAAAGIQLNGYRLTKRQLTKWTNEGTPHTVALHTLGGIYTSNGDGVYRSTEFQWNSVDEFWQKAARSKQGRAIMWESA